MTEVSQEVAHQFMTQRVGDDYAPNLYLLRGDAEDHTNAGMIRRPIGYRRRHGQTAHGYISL